MIKPNSDSAKLPKGCYRPALTGNIFSVFHFIKNENWPRIGQRKITTPKSKRRYFVETDRWAHRKEVAGDFFSSKSNIKNVEFGFVEGFVFDSLFMKQKSCFPLRAGINRKHIFCFSFHQKLKLARDRSAQNNASKI